MSGHLHHMWSSPHQVFSPTICELQLVRELLLLLLLFVCPLLLLLLPLLLLLLFL